MKQLISSIMLTCLFGGFVHSQGFFKLDFSDEFSGTELDLTKWDYQLGTGENGLWAWGNDEKEYYTKENASVADGFLIITAKSEQKGGMPYTSSRLTTRGRYFTTYGRIEARISLPAITGMWPAFWMLPQASPYGGWAVSGEIDIMEAKGRLNRVWSGTIHYGGNWPNNQYSSIGDKVFPDNGTIADFHIYAVEWTDEKISWFCDGIEVGNKTSWYADASHPKPAPFDVDFHIILNLAVGGNFDGGRVPPDSFTSGDMKVDYVRVYKWSDTLTEPEIPDDAGEITAIKSIGSDNKFDIFQNNNLITIQSAEEVRSAQLFSAFGRLLFQTQTNKINTTQLNKGLYILKVEDKKGNMDTFKVSLMK